MSGNMKPAAALFILVVMVLSVIGFSMNSASFQRNAEVSEIPNIIREPISVDEQLQILRSGKVIIEHFYYENCTDCSGKNAELESFVNKLEGYVVLNEVVGNDTRIDIIGTRGRIVDISNTTLDYESLIDTFCDIAIVQPRVCIIRVI